MFLSKYGVARVIIIPIVKRAVVDFAVGADWTPAAGDVKISKDGGAAANVTNLPTAIAMGNGAIWSFSLTATEMQAAQIIVTVADSATKAVEDQAIVIETYGHASAQHELDLDTPTVNPGAGGITASTIAADAIGASELATDAVTEIVDAVWAKAMTELSAVPAVTGSVLQALEWMFAKSRNKITQTATTVTLKKDNGTTTLGSAGASDDGTTMTVDKFT